MLMTLATSITSSDTLSTLRIHLNYGPLLHEKVGTWLTIVVCFINRDQQLVHS